MKRDKQAAIASMGGIAAQASGRAHRWTAEEAREAGRKGGHVTSQRNRREQALEFNGARVEWPGLEAQEGSETHGT